MKSKFKIIHNEDLELFRIRCKVCNSQDVKFYVTDDKSLVFECDKCDEVEEVEIDSK